MRTSHGRVVRGGTSPSPPVPAIRHRRRRGSRSHLGADRLRGARGLDDLFGVAAHRYVMQVLAEGPEELDEILAVVYLDVRDRLETDLLEPLGGLRTHP